MLIRSMLLGFVALLCAWDCAEGALIRLKTPVSASSGVVRLGDIADIQGVDAERLKQLSEVSVAPAPLQGRTLRLDYEGIRARLAAVGVPLGDVEFAGPSVVQVTTPERVELPAPTDTARKRVEDGITKSVQERVAEQAPHLGQLSVKVKIAPADVPLILTAVGGKYEVGGGQSPWTGDQLYAVRFVDREGKQHQVRVNCLITPVPRLLVTTRPIPRGTALRESDLTWDQVERAADAPTSVDRLELVIGQETIRALKKGDPITRSDIRNVPLVRSGDIVTVMSRRPGIVIRMEAKSQGDGALGETVTLTLLDRRQKLTAVVTGYHEAEVRGIDAKRDGNETNAGLRILSEQRK